MEVPWILLTTHINLGKFIVALPVSTQSLSQTVSIFYQVVVFFTFLTKDVNF